jgi:hypothetical protein
MKIFCLRIEKYVFFLQVGASAKDFHLVCVPIFLIAVIFYVFALK